MIKTLVLFLFLICGRLAAADTPFHPRLVEGAEGAVFGGYQLRAGDDAQFELFAVQPWHRQPGGLGRYNGRFADIAVDDAGRPLALTRDGALNALGDDPETLAVPDDRWHMLALAWTASGPEAVCVDGGRLWIARPDQDKNWRRDDSSIAATAWPAKARLLVVDGNLHVFWISRSADLSEGGVRHAVRHDGVWEELARAAGADVLAFAVRPDRDGIELITLEPDVLGASKPRILTRLWDGAAWSPAEAAPGGTAERLASAHDFAIAGDAVLRTGSGGASLVVGGAREQTFTLLDAAPEALGYSAGVSSLLMIGFVVLLLLYCRRSRALSRRFPGRPPDLISRTVALGVDWMLVSIAMSAYHIANGDIVIFQDLLSLGAVNDIFWINLAALALFMAMMEGVYGYTPGKKLAGMRVRSAYGGKPGFLQALFRNAMRAADMFPVGIGFPGLVGLIAAMLNPRRQRIGDMLAATMVRRHVPYRERAFVLASASPRRRDLLTALGVEFVTLPSEVDEFAPEDESPRETVTRLSMLKAEAAVATAGEHAAIIIAADTVVALDDDILGKPADAAEATSMLERLSGRSHTVYTGVTVWDGATGQTLCEVEETEVEFRELSRSEIDNYVASGDPLDKAGGYGVQSGFLVRQVRGSLSNVMGLPMEKLQAMLASLDS